MMFADLYDPGAGAERLWSAWKKWFASTGASAEEVDRVFSKTESEISFVSERNLAQILNSAGFEELTCFYKSFLWGAWWAYRVGDVKDVANDDGEYRP